MAPFFGVQVSPFRCAMSVTTSVCTLTTHVECSRQNATTPCSCSLHVNNNILYSSQRKIKMPRLPAVVRFTSKYLHSLQLLGSRQNVYTPHSCSLHVKMSPLPTAVRFTSKCPHSLQLFASRQNVSTPYSCSLASFTARGALQELSLIHI